MVNQIKKTYHKTSSIEKIIQKDMLHKGQIRDNNIHRYIIEEINKHDQYFQKV